MWKSKRRRGGVTMVETAIVLAFILVVAVVAMRTLGTATSDDMSETAEDIGDPSQLVERFGNGEN